MTVEMLCGADDFRHLRHAVDWYAETPLADTAVADTAMAKREDLRHRVSDVARLDSRSRASAGRTGRAGGSAAGVWKVGNRTLWCIEHMFDVSVSRSAAAGK
jgi:hypothetical protein